MTNLSSSFNLLLNQSSLNNFLQYSSLIGKKVSYFQFESGEYVGEAQATVVSVVRVNEDIVLRLDNGKEIYSDQVFEIEQLEEVTMDGASD